MKKLVYLFLAVGFVFTGCDPMEDIHEEIDATINNGIDGEISFVMEEDDYDTAGVDNDYFSSLDEAIELIPSVLEDRYPSWGAGSLAFVTFNYNVELVDEDDNPIPPVEYTVTDQDYDDMGLNFGNFDDVNDLYAFLEYKYPNADNGSEVILTYEWYDGSANTLTDVFYLNENWTRYSALTDDDYEAMDQNFPNFNSQEDALQRIPVYMTYQLYPYADAGDVQNIAYEVHIGGGNTEYHKASYEFNGTQWVLISSGNLFTETVQFGHNGDFWEPDNTINHTMTSADFAFIGEELIEEYPEPADSAGYYGNFDRRPSNTAYWSNDMILEAINLLLDNMHPDAEEGQKYVVSYAIYNGSAGVESMSVIKESGEWVLNE